MSLHRGVFKNYIGGYLKITHLVFSMFFLVDIVDKLIYNIIVKILQAPSRDKQLTTKEEEMKIKLLENDKIIEVPNYWKWHLVEGKKVIIDQNKKIIALVIEE